MIQYFYSFERCVCYVVCKFCIQSCWFNLDFFLYGQLKDGFSCPKNNVGKLYFLECFSQNNPRVRKPSPRAIVNYL
jgi:hypothetical protein